MGEISLIRWRESTIAGENQPSLHHSTLKTGIDFCDVTCVSKQSLQYSQGPRPAGSRLLLDGPELELLRRRGFSISQAIIDAVLRQAGE